MPSLRCGAGQADGAGDGAAGARQAPRQDTEEEGGEPRHQGGGSAAPATRLSGHRRPAQNILSSVADPSDPCFWQCSGSMTVWCGSGSGSADASN
jgi:hypothetical protein